MDQIIESIKVNAPVRTVFDQWMRFEEFPKMMDHVDEVRRIDDTHLHWKANVGGKTLEWDSEIVEQVADQRISWCSTNGHKHAGTVEFRPLSANATEVIVVIAHEPQGLLEALGGTLGVAKRRVMLDLECFKQFMEARHGETATVAREELRGT